MIKALPRLTKTETKSLDLLSNFYSKIENLFRDSEYSIKVNKSEEEFKDYYLAIPISSYYIDTLFKIRKLFKNNTIAPKFLDVGCGYGNVVALAKSFGFDAYGIEIRDTYKSIHDKICYGRVFYTDAFKFNTYKEYNVIYLYCPIKNPDLMQELLIKIAKEVKKGTVICCFGTGYYGRIEGTKLELKQLKNTTSEVWAKE